MGRRRASDDGGTGGPPHEQLIEPAKSLRPTGDTQIYTRDI